MKNKKILFISLGCDKNLVDSEVMLGILADRGFEMTDTEVDADIIIIDPEREYSQLVNAMGGEVINISATSDNHINAMDMNKDYGDGANPVILKSEFIMSLCEQLIGGTNLGATIRDIYRPCRISGQNFCSRTNRKQRNWHLPLNFSHTVL